MARSSFTASFCISLAICCLVGCFSGLVPVNTALALHPQYEAALHTALLDIYYAHPAYISPLRVNKDGTVGAMVDDDDEVDCSLLFDRAAEQGGIPKKKLQRRSTASGIYKGENDWQSKAIADYGKDNRKCDLIFQHIPTSKGGLKKKVDAKDPYGVNHILGVVEWKGAFAIIHASSSARSVVIIPFQEWIAKYMVPNGYRRLIYGD